MTDLGGKDKQRHARSQQRGRLPSGSPIIDCVSKKLSLELT